MSLDAQKLYDIARAALRPMELGRHGEAGQVACALESASGAVYTGICIDLPCSLGFCAEQAAAAQMLKDGEASIRRIVAVHEEDGVIPPCGRCREFLIQLDDANADTLVVVPSTDKAGLREMRLAELLPARWDEDRV